MDNEALTWDAIKAILELLRHEHHTVVRSWAEAFERLPEPTPYERGALDRYQDKRHSWRKRQRDRR